MRAPSLQCNPGFLLFLAQVACCLDPFRLCLGHLISAGLLFKAAWAAILAILDLHVARRQSIAAYRAQLFGRRATRDQQADSSTMLHEIEEELHSCLPRKQTHRLLWAHTLQWGSLLPATFSKLWGRPSCSEHTYAVVQNQDPSERFDLLTQDPEGSFRICSSRSMPCGSICEEGGGEDDISALRASRP